MVLVKESLPPVRVTNSAPESNKPDLTSRAFLHQSFNDTSVFPPSFEGFSLSVFLLRSVLPVALAICSMPTPAFL
ncbi:hypothetical protein [Serratia ficaria]|uniref:hypothetical protein n=1 Tax=Serratia ficaria TaxID=61651 RepID=UPI0021B7D071|nr:hypothetical protein [Serratia ficaria]